MTVDIFDDQRTVDWEIHKMFTMDSRDKKITGRGVFNRASRRGHKGPMRTPSDFMSQKERKEYQKPSKVEVKTMEQVMIEDQVKNAEEGKHNQETLTSIPYREGKAILHVLIGKYTNAQLQKMLHVSYYELYKLQKHFQAFRQKGFPRSKKATPEYIPTEAEPTTEPTVEPTSVASIATEEPTEEIRLKRTTDIVIPQTEIIVEPTNKSMLTLLLRGSGNEVSEQIHALVGMLLSERKYQISLEIHEEIAE